VRVWVRLTVLMAVLVLVPLAWVGSLAYTVTVENATLRPREALHRDAAALATLVASRLDAASDSLAGWHRLWRLEDHGVEEQTNFLRAVWTASRDVVSVALVDGRGRQVVAPVWQDAPGPERVAGSGARWAEVMAHRPLRAASGVTAGAPYRVDEGGSIRPAVPLLSVRDDSKLRILAEVDLGAVAEALVPSPGASVALLDGSLAPIVAVGESVWSDPDVLAMLETPTDLDFDARLADGRDVRGAVALVGRTGWRVVLAEPAGIGAEAAGRLRAQTLAIASLALAVVLLAGFALQPLLSRPLSNLRTEVLAVAEGAYDRRIPPGRMLARADELGDLARAFNEMASRLSDGRQEITEKRARIEALVATQQAEIDRATSALVSTQAELVRAGQFAALADVAAGLAHELNNPLSGVLGLAQWQISRAPGEAGAWRQVEALAQRCREVVSAMLRFQAGEESSAYTRSVDLAASLRAAWDRAELDRWEAWTLDVAGGGSVAAEPVLLDQLWDRWLATWRSALPHGATVRVVARGAEVTLWSGVAEGGADEPAVAGMQRWLALRLVAAIGGRCEEPRTGGLRSRIVLTEAP
jgi:two-component system NtrC family sensor kinase